jgi:hypothetical protein
MPWTFRIYGFVIGFYSGDHEPIHVHVKKAGCEAKVDLKDLKIIKSKGFKKHELNNVLKLVEKYQEVLERAWYAEKDKEIE